MIGRLRAARSLLVALIFIAEGAHAGEIAAFGDVHGAYRELTQLLTEQNVIDSSGTWHAGALQLVSLGDLVDRGDDGREVLELLMNMQLEAQAAGGRLHVVLGNHEIMNLTGELDYVSAGDYARFALEESEPQRTQAFERMRAVGRFDPDGETDARAQFDAAFPRGYFARMSAFAADGRYGKWLLDQTIVLQIGDTLFVHGGLPPILAQASAVALSRRLIEEVGAYARAWHAAMNAGLIDPDTPMAERVALATRRLTEKKHQALIDALARTEQSVAFDVDGPAWYRGQALCHPAYEDDVLTAALARQGAVRVVVGHTVNVQRRVVSRFGGRVVLADTGMLNAVYRGRASMVYLRDGKTEVVYAGETPRQVPLDDPVLVGPRPGAIDDSELERRMSGAPAVADTDSGDGRRLVKLDVGGSTIVDAALLPKRGKGPWQGERELTAYRLDRLLDLRLIPPTVERAGADSHPVAQLLPAGTITHAQRAASGEAGQGWCPLRAQYDLMAAFDALIGLAARDPRTFSYTKNDPMLLLSGHGGAFGTSARLPDYLAKAQFTVSATLAARLKALDETRVAAALPALSKRQVSALLERRDALLARRGLGSVDGAHAAANDE